MSLSSLAFLFLAVVAVVRCRPDGPPVGNDVCVNLRPSSGAPHMQQIGHYGYRIDTTLPLNVTANMYRYTANGTYSVTLLGNVFRGFLMQAMDPAGMVIGTFQTSANTQQILDCSAFNGIGATATIAHNNVARADFNSQTFTWTAPDGDGYVVFMYTLVPRTAEYFGPLMSPPPPPEAPTRAANDYPLSFRLPENCQPGMDCQVFVGIAVNVISYGYLDIYMEAVSESWIALGFSATMSMFSSDVAVCVYDRGMSAVVALDTYNAASPTRNNIVDNQQNVVLFNSSHVNDTIQCTISKRIMGVDTPNQDLDLNENYWLLYARGNSGSAQGINGHMPNNPLFRGFFPAMVNPVTGVAVTQAPDTQTTTDGATKVAAPGLLMSFLAATVLLFMKM